MSKVDTTCPLCAPTDEKVIWSNSAFRVILVDDDSYPGFTRLIWNAHVAEMTDLSAGDRDLVMQGVWAIERVQRRLLQPDKINLASLGNMVPHLHWHIVPRWTTDPCFPDAIWAAPRRALADAGEPGLAVARQALPRYVEALRAELAGCAGLKDLT